MGERTQDQLASQDVNEPVIILEVETPQGVFLRPILPATLLPDQGPRGPAAEGATRSAAAYWGLPDFVFRPQLHSRGSGNRELGDAVLLVGTLGACVQVKSRQAVTPTDSRERSWFGSSFTPGNSQCRDGDAKCLSKAKCIRSKFHKRYGASHPNIYAGN